MTADLRTAAQKALVALEYHTQQTRPIEQTEHAIKALMEVLAAPSPAEGDSWPCSKCGVERSHLPACAQDGCPLMLNGLTEAETNETASVKGLIGQPQPKGNDKADEWRKLAQQFDGQRMAAMVHLRTLLAFPQAHAEAARAFLAATPAEQIASVQAPAPVDGQVITERGRHHVAGLRSIREHHELSGDELTALTVAIAVMGNPPAMPCNEELERVAKGHQGHPADFAADALQRWGGWQPGLLGYGGKLNAKQAPAVQDGKEQA